MMRLMIVTTILARVLAGIPGTAEPLAPAIISRYVAIDNVCAWPNLTVLRDGTIIATIFNQPSHGRAEGDVECWATTDGRFWTKHGTAAPHEDSANRMNVAAGMASNGDLIVLSSGWSLKKDDKGKVVSLAEVLAPWICRSSDVGSTWKVDKDSFPRTAEGWTQYIPFGDILPGGDGALRVVCYARDKKTKEDGVWMFRSADDGKKWEVQSRISESNNETAIFHLGSGKWLAAARSLGKTKQRLDLFRSEDDGKTWTASDPLSEASQHPGHLVRLKDGRLLLTYGNRIPGKFGVEAKISADEGTTWSDPISLVSDLTSGDCGYPSSVQLPSGEILTAYYTRGVASHQRYHMGVIIWKLPATGAPPVSPPAKKEAALDLGSKRELFVDDYLIEKMSGVNLKLHNPVEREVVLTFDRLWEDQCSGIATVFRDGDRYRMYYRGRSVDGLGLIGSYLCYAESTDGIQWTRPNLGLHEFRGSKDNNIVLDSYFPVFKDANPHAPESERYKGFGNVRMPDGKYPLTAMASPDGYHWRRMQDGPVITHGDFDSPNLAFYDPLRQQYMAYYRSHQKGKAYFRDIFHATSIDFLHWNDALEQSIIRSKGEEEHLYTSSTTPYFRAPHIYIALPMRYMAQRAAKARNADGTWGVGNNDKKMWGVTDAVLMTSRDGIHFDRRFLEAFIRPGLDHGRWVTRNNLPSWGIIPTPRQDMEGQEELSVFWHERYYTPGCQLRRGTLRLDGFVSVNAPFQGGQLVTKPFTFIGKALTINYSTSAAGSIVVELLDADGKPIPGCDAKSCPEIYGDETEHEVAWKDGTDLSRFAGCPVRLRFVMKDADLYSIQFRP